jgi:4-oxalocrotonate tautomerase
MVETIGIPEQDKFQVVTEHDADGLIYDPSYLGISRGDGVVFIQITLSAGRTLEIRKALFARIVQLLRERPGIRPEDVFVNLVETAKENWSFGNGVAQYAS